MIVRTVVIVSMELEHETKVGKDAKEGARDATGALGRAREGEHRVEKIRRTEYGGWK